MTAATSPRPIAIWSMLAAIVVAYLVIASLYAIETPAWQVPDEPAHYNYIVQIVQTGQIPSLQAGDWNNTYLNTLKDAHFAPEAINGQLSTIRYEDHQPPLYYLAETPIAALTNDNLIAMRLFSVLIGAGVVIVAFAVIMALFPTQPILALATAAFIAFLPQHVAMMAGVENDGLTELLIGLTLWACLHYLAGAPISPIVIGLCVGLALITKVTSYSLVGVVGLTWLLYTVRMRWKLGRALQEAARFAIPALILAGIWWLHEIQMYGFPDFLGLRRHAIVVVGQQSTFNYLTQNGLSQTIRDGIVTSFHSFWGQFGWMGVPLPNSYYTVLAVFTLFCAIGAVIAFNRYRAQLSWAQRDGLIILAISGLLAIAEIVYYNLSFVQFQGRYLYPGLIAIAFCFATGLYGWLSLIPVAALPVRTVRWLTVATMFIFAILDIVALYKFIIPQLRI